MNNIKALLFAITLSFSATLHFSVAAMEIVPFNQNSWQQSLAGLSYNSNWDMSKDIPTNEWMSGAVESATNLITENKKSRTELTNELDGALRNYYQSNYLLFLPSGKINSIKRDFLASVNEKLENTYQQQQQLQQKKEEKRVQKKQWLEQNQTEKQLLQEKLAQFRQAHAQKKEEEFKKIQHADIAWKTDLGNFSKDLMNLSQEANWYEDNSIKQKWMEKLVPTQEWMSAAAQSANELVKTGRVTVNEVLTNLDRALLEYYNKKSDKSFVKTIELVKDRFAELLGSPTPKYAQFDKPEQKSIKKIKIVPLIEKEDLELSKARQELQREVLLDDLKISRGLNKAWQDDVIAKAIKVINAEVENKNQWIKNIFYAISTAISDYIKTLWFANKQTMIAAEYNIFKTIDAATVGEFKNFIEYCSMVASSDVDTLNIAEVVNNSSDIHWIFNQRETYFDLNPITKKEIAEKAIALINQNIPVNVIEYAINKELQDARKGKSPKFRSAQGLGIMKAIKEELPR